MRKACLKAIAPLARRDQRVVFIGSDLGHGVMCDFQREFPERFFMEGVNEQAIVGMAAGMALEGRIPYVHTIATFLTRRCFEQVVVDVCMHDLPVRLLAAGGGVVYAPLGSTHLAIEDLAILRPIPNLGIIAPADAVEMARAMEASLDWPHPLYIRFAKGGETVVTPDRPFAIGQALRLREGADAVIITTGTTLQTALDALAPLAARGVAAGVLHLPTIKPFDAGAVAAAVRGVPQVATIEEHVRTGGLGSAVAELIADAGMAKRLHRLSLPDAFPHFYGSQNDHRAAAGISVAGLVAALTGATP
jgi:transketolase